MRQAALWILTATLLAPVARAQGVTAQAGKFVVQVATEPSPPASGSNTFTFTVTDAGKPLAGASVACHVDMTTMPMPADFAAVPGGKDGEYVATVNLSMGGQWKVTVAVQQMAGMAMAGDGEAHFLVDTGKSIVAQGGGGGGKLPWRRGLLVVVALLVLVGLVLLVRRRGLPPGSRGVLVGLLTLAVVAAGTWWVVRRYRDPRVSTVIGSALMNMDAMQPVASATPVETERVRGGEFEARVVYTATVVADREEDIYPRVTGRLVEMPLYPGDRVRAGQVVARLDTAELAAKQAQAAAGRVSASREVSAARADVSSARAGEGRSVKAVEQARTQVDEALADVRTAEGGIGAREGALEGASQMRREAESAVAAAQAAVEEADQTVVQADAEVDSAQADVTYWEAEIAREKVLFGRGAISREELDRETAQAAAAAARLKRSQGARKAAQASVTRARREVDGAQARVAAAAAGVRTAQAGVAQARADRDGALARVARARAGVGTALADVQAASAGVRAASSKVGVAQARTTEAAAALTEASVVKGYTVIRAGNPGVVTARLVSPGVLVQPGMSVARVAKLDYVRLQAPLSEADMARVRPGSPIEAWAPDDPQTPLVGEITTLFPARDAMSRTGIAEARIENPGDRLVPGQTVRMAIGTTDEGSRLSVPTAALIVREGRSTVFVAAQDNGRLVARQVTVKTGGEAGDRTEIISGLKAGDEVIVVGHDNLHDGDAVSVEPPGGEPSGGEGGAADAPPDRRGE